MAWSKAAWPGAATVAHPRLQAGSFHGTSLYPIASLRGWDHPQQQLGAQLDCRVARLSLAGGACLYTSLRKALRRSKALTALCADSQGQALLTSAAIGVSTGCGVLLFEELIKAGEEVRAFIPFGLAPLVGGLIVCGVSAWAGPKGLKGTDIGSLKSYAVPGGPSPPENWTVRAGANAMLAAVTLGFGNSLGPEAPAAVLGSNVAYGVSKALSLFGAGQPKAADGEGVDTEQQELIQAALLGSKIVAALEPKELKKLLSSFREVRLAAGDTLMRQGDIVSDNEPGLYITESGELDVYVAAEGTTGLGEQVFTYREGGEVIGELAVLFNAPRAATVVAKSDCMLWSVDRASFLAVGGRSQGAARTLFMNPESVLASGAAAGVSAGFNAPIAGIFFATEVVRPTGENSLDLVTRLLAAALSAAVVRTFAGAGPGLGSVPAWRFAWLGGNTELLIFLVLGALVGCAAYGFSKSQAAAKSAMTAVGAMVPASALPLAGALATLVLSLLCNSRVQFDGFGALLEVLIDSTKDPAIGANQWSLASLLQPRGLGDTAVLSAAALLALVPLKIAATALCQTSGLVGGVFAPSLYMGACLGGAFGRAASLGLAGLSTISGAGTYVVVGAAAMLAANCSVPITSTVLALELAGGQSYEATLPIISCIAVAIYTSRVLLPQQLEGLSRQEALEKLNEAQKTEDCM